MSNDSSNFSTYYVDNGRQVSLEGPLGEAGRAGYWARGGLGQGVPAGVAVVGGVYVPPATAARIPTKWRGEGT